MLFEFIFDNMAKSTNVGKNTKSRKKTKELTDQNPSEISETLKELAEKYPYNLINRAFCEFSKDFKKNVDVARPTPIDKETYKKFANTCHNNERPVNVVLECLCDLYSTKGESIF